MQQILMQTPTTNLLKKLHDLRDEDKHIKWRTYCPFTFNTRKE
jgi:hypothetical protein